MGYVLNESAPWWSLQEMERSAARAEYQKRMATKSERVEELRKLVARFGIALNNTDASVQLLNDWFLGVMNPLVEMNIPDGRSLSVCEDVALFLGENMISRHPELRWEFFIWGKRNVSFQSPVIMGFSREDPKWHSNLALDRLVYAYGVNVLQHRIDESGHTNAADRELASDSPPLDKTEFVAMLRRVDERCRSL